MERLKQSVRQETGDLFAREGQFRLVELGKADAERLTDRLKVLRGLIETNQPMYPNIGRWFDEKVVPGLRSTQRIAWVAYEGENAIASAVLKLGGRSKFCHLRIHQDFQDRDLGQMFFTQMTMEARRHAREIHFTLPESLWSSKSEFFESFGFTHAARARRQYRRGDPELSCSASIATVWTAVVSKLPALAAKFRVGGYRLNNKILVSIKPKYAEQILSGEKSVEVRRKFSRKWVGCRAVLYASSPLCALVGEATVSSITIGRSDEIWSRFGSRVGCSSDEFEAYAGSAPEVSAIELSEVVPYLYPVSLAQVSHLVQENLRPPQSFCDLRLDGDSPWAKAVSMASLLHGRFGYLEKTHHIVGE
jgi:predicted transcriptional regulator/N-acetylglutamate synthase-like GNAT family acetyltransferase